MKWMQTLSDEDMKQIDEPEDENADSAETADAAKTENTTENTAERCCILRYNKNFRNSQEYYIIFRL